EYIRDRMLPDSFGLARAHSNVVVLRTFSKAYGLAGLRVGYAVGDPDIVTALGKVYVPFSATSISQANFVWLPLPGRAQKFAADSANSRIIVRPYGDDGVRVTVASKDENDMFLEFAKGWPV